MQRRSPPASFLVQRRAEEHPRTFMGAVELTSVGRQLSIFTSRLFYGINQRGIIDIVYEVMRAEVGNDSSRVRPVEVNECANLRWCNRHFRPPSPITA